MIKLPPFNLCCLPRGDSIEEPYLTFIVRGTCCLGRGGLGGPSRGKPAFIYNLCEQGTAIDISIWEFLVDRNQEPRKDW